MKIKLWVVVACSRPHKVDAVVSQFRALAYRNKALCIVTSGPAWDNEHNYATFRGNKPDILLAGPAGKGPALNVALDALPGEFVVIRDDDDLYTPSGLDEFALHLQHFDFVAQRRHWVRMANGALRLFAADNHSKVADTCRIWGGNLGLRVGEARFGSDPVTQCQDYAKERLSAGARGWLKSPQGACLARGESDHLWQASDEMVAHISGASWAFPDADLSRVDARVVSLLGALAVPAPDVYAAHAAELRRLGCGT